MKTTTISAGKSGNREMRLYLKEISKLPLLTIEEEKDLAVRARQGDRDAVQKLIESNLRFVIRIAKNYSKSAMPLLDLINEGNVGLIEAARRFDPDRNVRFTTYAVWWIRQAILRYLADASHAFRVSPRATNIIYRVAAARRKRGLDAEPQTREALAEEIGVSLKELNSALEATSGTYSLDHPVDAAGELLLGDLLEQTIIPSAETLTVKNHMKKQMEDSLEKLSWAEQKVLRLRFGLDEDTPMTLKEIGDRMDLSRERIRQIEAQALHKLRESSASLATYLH